jgi:outer membrane protein assembly factor BamB
MLASDSPKVTFVVQQSPLLSYPTLPLPQDYWTRPINNELTEWSAIAGNWLTATNVAATNNRIAVGNDEAPRSAHILWVKPLTSGGLVGGSLNPASQEVSSARIEIGDAYEGKFLGSVIMLGKLYYDKYATAEIYHEIACVDLHTGEQLWSRVLLNNLTLARGQLLNWKTMDLVGVYDYLWATANTATLPLLGLNSTAGTTWCAFNPFTGDYYYTLYGIPSGSVVYGPNGEILVYTLNQANGWMTMWNSTNIPALYASTEYLSMGWSQWHPFQKVVNATGRDGVTLNGLPYKSYLTPLGLNGYMWNVTIPKGLLGSVISVQDDRIVGGTYSTTRVNLWALSLISGQEGKLLYNTTWTPPADWAAGNVTIAWQATSNEGQNGVLILGIKETLQDYGFSTGTGQYLWVTEPRKNYLDFYTIGLAATSSRSVNNIYDGRFYTGSYSGILYCYNITTGKLLWAYTASNPYAEGATYDNWPLYPCFIAGGMIYIVHAEHSGYQQVLPPGAPFICLNATSGDVVWRANGLFRGTHWGGYPLIGDSIITTMNTYDQQIYAIGKGPSATTVQAPMTAITVGDTVVIQGTVTDVSPGTKGDALTLRFPNGVPAVSDDSMSDWMGYVYEQFPRPANATGVTVSIDAVDPNGNCIHIATVTSDASGLFHYMWKTPDVPGEYTVTATFAGSESYYASYAETAMAVQEAPPSPTPTPAAAPLPPFDLYILIATVVIVIAIAIATVLLLRKRP